MRTIIVVLAALQICASSLSNNVIDSPVPDFVLERGQEHYASSRAIPPVVRVDDGATFEAHIRELSEDRVTPGMTAEAHRQLTWQDPFGYPLARPVYVKGAEPSDILAVTLHKVGLGDWGWTDTDPHYAYLGEELDEVHLKTYIIDADSMSAEFSEKITIPLEY